MAKGLSALMELRGVTSSNLAESLGVSRYTILLWRREPQEIGKAGRRKLCEYFRCRESDLENFEMEE